MAGICDKEASFLTTASTQGNGFCRELQVTGYRFRCHVRTFAAMQCAFGIVFFDQLVDQRVQSGDVAFTGQVGHDVTFWIHNHQGRPSSGGVGLPGDQFRIIEYRVSDVVAFNGCSNCRGFRFVIKFW